MEIKTNDLKAAVLFAAKKDPRYYLQGICVEVVDCNKVILVAADGHTLFAKRIETGTTDTSPGSYIIPIEALKGLANTESVELSFILNDSGPDSVTINQGNTSSTHRLIDGKFPDWRRIIPKELTGVPCDGINTDYLTRAAKAIKLMGYNNDKMPIIKMLHSGKDAVVITPRNDVIMLVVPARTPEGSKGFEDYSKPAWV